MGSTAAMAGMRKEFARSTELDDWEYYGDATLELEWKPISFGSGVAFTETSDPIDLVTFTQRLQVIRSSETPFVRFRQDRWDVFAQYLHQRFEFTDHDFSFNDYRKNQGLLRVKYAFSDDWAVFAQGMGGHTDFELRVKNDYDLAEATLGVQGHPLAPFDFIVEAGWRSHDFDPDSGGLVLEDDYNSWVARVTLRWKPTDADQLIAAYSHGVEESVQTNFQTVDRAQLRYTRTFGDRFDVSAQTAFELRREADEDVTQDRKEVFTGGLSATYRILPWLPANATYTYSEKWSNDDVGEYEDHRAMLSTTIQF